MSGLKWGIIGTGAIANEFAAALRNGGLSLEAVASRTAEKAEAFALAWKIDRAFGSYEELIQCDDVDIVYVATPHNYHFEWAEKALLCGKHVLCEKAITVDGDELRKLCAIANEKGLVLREAMTIYHMPVLKKLRQMVGADAPLGRLCNMDIAFGSFKPYHPENRFFNPDLAGGAMLDIGVYALSAARMFMSEAPDTVLFDRVDAPSGVDDRWGIVLKNSKNEIAAINVALRGKMPKRAVYSCEKGYIVVDEYPRADSGEIFWVEDGRREKIAAGDSGKALLYEAESVESAVINGDDGEIMKLTVDVMELMDRLRK